MNLDVFKERFREDLRRYKAETKKTNADIAADCGTCEKTVANIYAEPVNARSGVLLEVLYGLKDRDEAKRALLEKSGRVNGECSRSVRVRDLLSYIDNADSVQIVELGNPEPIYIGYKGCIQHTLEPERLAEIENRAAIDFKLSPEVTHRRWRELGLDSPLKPSDVAEFEFKDLQLTCWRKIYI